MRRSNALWGTLLIFVGLIWILNSTRVVNIDIWGSIMTLWPVFIIAAGITFFVKRDSHIQQVILWLLVFAIIGGYGIYLGYDISNETNKNNKFIMEPEIKSASIKISIASANVDISATNQSLADIRTNIKGLKSDYDEGSNPKITYSQKMQFNGLGKNQKFNASLNNTILWDIELNTGAVDGSLNFKDFSLVNCSINTGACDLDIVAGNKQESSRIVINGAAVNLNLNIPEDVGIKIHSSSAATKISGNVDLLKENGVYQSENYANAKSKLYFDIASAASNIRINR